MYDLGLGVLSSTNPTPRNTSARYLIEASTFMHANLCSPPRSPHDPGHWDLLTNHTNEEIFESRLLINWTSDDYRGEPETPFLVFLPPRFSCIAFHCIGTARLKHRIASDKWNFTVNMFPVPKMARLIFLIEG